MLKFFSRKKTDASPEPAKPGWFGRLKHSLSRTRAHLSQELSHLFLGKKTLDEALLEDIETLLISADVGIQTTEYIISTLTAKIARHQLKEAQAVYPLLKETLLEVLAPSTPPVLDLSAKPYVILLVGINGAGKTTTVGKLAHYFRESGQQVMLGAGDTFRAAAIEQLQVWGTRNHVPVVAQHTGADSASVLFDALRSAQSKEMDVLLADTAGRLHTQENLMAELKKVKRVLQKATPEAPHAIWLVLDAGIGQNALVQATKFHEALGVTGLILTKLDGTAKGGCLFAIAHQLKLPLYFIGTGEGIEDLQRFDPTAFIAALFEEEPPAEL